MLLNRLIKHRFVKVCFLMNEFGNLTLRSIQHETLSPQIQGLLPHLQYQCLQSILSIIKDHDLCKLLSRNGIVVMWIKVVLQLWRRFPVQWSQGIGKTIQPWNQVEVCYKIVRTSLVVLANNQSSIDMRFLLVLCSLNISQLKNIPQCKAAALKSRRFIPLATRSKIQFQG